MGSTWHPLPRHLFILDFKRLFCLLVLLNIEIRTVVASLDGDRTVISIQVVLE